MMLMLMLLGITMILFAETSNDTLYAFVIFLGLLLKFLEKIYDNYQANKIKAQLLIADKKKTEHLNAQDIKLNTIAEQVSDVAGSVEVVKSQTNGVIDKIETAAYQKGVSDAIRTSDVSEQTALPSSKSIPTPPTEPPTIVGWVKKDK